jgi:hypothetical protein
MNWPDFSSGFVGEVEGAARRLESKIERLPSDGFRLKL